MREVLTQTWSWWFSGAMIAGIMFFLLYFGQSFGFSSNLRTLCAASGVGKKVKFFNFNWKAQTWNLVFLIGAIIGGFIAKQFLSNDLPVQISGETISDLSKELLAQTEKLEVVDDKVLEDLLARFIDLRRANAMVNNIQLRFLQDEDQQQGGANIKMYQEQNLRLAKLLHNLDQAKRKMSLKRQA